MPSSESACEQERNYRLSKCERLIGRHGDVDRLAQDRLRRLAVYPGLPAEQRAVIWKLFLKLLTPMRETWSFAEQQRRESYESLLEVCYVGDHHEPEDVLRVLTFYSTLECSRAAMSDSPQSCSIVKPKCVPTARAAELEPLRAMLAVLKGVFVHDYQIFWCLVMLRRQQNRIAISQNGTNLQLYSSSDRVLAFAKRLAVVDPDLSSLLESKFMICPSMYADKWFQSLFALPFGQGRAGAVIRVWDALIASPFELVVHVAVHLTLRMKPAIQTVCERTSDPAPVVRLLETLPGITKADMDDVLHTIWRNETSLFRGGSQLDDFDRPISFSIQWPVVRYGAINSSLVKILQFLLRARGLGSIFFVDGTYGERTAHMVKRFRATMQSRLIRQQKWEYPSRYLASEMEDGNLVGPELWPLLIEPLEYQSKRNFAIKALQTALVELRDMPNLRVDGYFGYQTLHAVLAFQSGYAANRIDVDGIAGPLTWLHLLGGQTETDQGGAA